MKALFNPFTGEFDYIVSPEGIDGAIQFNDDGDFGADDSLFWDNTNKRLGIGTISPTKKLEVRDTSTSAIKVSQETDSSNATLQVNSGAYPSLFLIHNAKSGTDSVIKIDPTPSDGEGDSTYAIFRSVNTTGQKKILFHKGDGTGGVQHKIADDTHDTYFCALGGDVGIGTTTPDAKLQVVGSTYLGGDGTNYTEFKDNGTMVMHGTATVFDDMQMPMLSTTKQNPSGKIIENAVEQTLDFSDSADMGDYAVASMQMSHKWKLGSAISPHIHWTQTKAGNPNWLIQYRWQRNNGAKTTAWTDLKLNTPVFTYVSGSLNQISDGDDITPPTGYSVSDVVQFRIIRDTNDDSGLFGVSDPVSGDVSTLSFDFHYEIDTLGSESEYTK